MVSRSHAPRHQGLGATDPSGGETTWATRPDYEGNRRGHHVCGARRAAPSWERDNGESAAPPRSSIAVAGGPGDPDRRLGSRAARVVVAAGGRSSRHRPRASWSLEFTQTLNPAALVGVRHRSERRTSGQGEVDSGEEIRIPLATNVPGVYTVDWVSVSQVDGHRITGELHLRCRVSPGPVSPGAPRTRSRARSSPTSRSARSSGSRRWHCCSSPARC